MKFGFGTCNINPMEPVMRFGGRYGTEKYDLPVRGDFICPVIAMENDDGELYVHVSLANPDIELKGRNVLHAMLQEHLGRTCSFTICGTHTHYAPNINKDTDYLTYVGRQICACIDGMEIKEYEDLSVSFEHLYFDKVGQSRITGHTAKNLYINTLCIRSGENRIATMIVYNCHASTINMKVDYFTSAGPGYLLKHLQEAHPGEFFTYMCGAAGDVSTRNTRPGQSYEDMETMAQLVLEAVEGELAMPRIYVPFDAYELTELWMPVERQYKDLNYLEIPNNLTEREREVIAIEIEDQKKGRVDINTLPKTILFQRLTFGTYSLLFTPFEMFSEYIDYIDKDHAAIVNLSNDRICYLSGFHLKTLSFESFGESISEKSKHDIAELLHCWSRMESEASI